MTDTTSSNIGDNSEIEIEHGELQGLLDELVGKQKAVTEATGSLRSRIKQIIDQKGWHKGALADIRKIDAMSDTQRADYLRTFEAMFDVMISKKWHDQMQDLFEQEEERNEE